MADISASVVMELRKISGQGMMDCKKALNEADGDIEKAMVILRKKGAATLEKRSGRETSEGVVVSRISDDGKTATMATLCCETDFVAKSDNFGATAEKLIDYAMVCGIDEGAENVLETAIDGVKFEEILTEAVSKTGEKTLVGDYAKYSINGTGLLCIYVHFNKKIGTMVEIETSDDNVASSDVVKEAANDVAMHITATKPLALDKDEIAPETIEREKAIFAEQVTNKPPEIIEKIVEGKLRKFFAENCLLDQPFVKDDSKTVGEVIAEASRQTGGEVKIKRFVRFGIG